MHKLILLICLSVSLAFTPAYATTWNEPWADEVIKGASSFVLAKVVKSDPQKGVEIRVIKILGGKELPASLSITSFYLLNLCSTSDDGPEFHIAETDSCYFFIHQDAKGQYGIATPTTGFDYVDEGKVVATFRHSYHQASVPVAVYEMTMTAIFNHYHGLPYKEAEVRRFIDTYLALSPAGFGEGEIDTFFLQHVALEMVHHLRLAIDERLVYPFLNDGGNFHNQVSAARALVAFPTPATKEALLRALGDTSKRNFVKVMCVWSLKELQPADALSTLTQLQSGASEEEDDFGGILWTRGSVRRCPTSKKPLPH